MAGVQWTQNMETGIGIVDEQHRELFRRIDQLLDAMRAGKGREHVGELMEFLKGYVMEHFRTEEAIWRKGGLPDFERHRAVHEAFKRDLAQLADEHARDPGKLSLTIEVQRRVMEWLREHILKVDKKAAETLGGRIAA